MRSQYTFRIGLVVAAGALAAGCGVSSDTSSSPSGSASAAPDFSPSAGPSAAPSAESSLPSPATVTSGPEPLPTITMTIEPPREPTDNLPETGWVVGMVTRGGSGPCYGLIADDGTRYALYNADGITLTKAKRVKVKLETTPLRIYCGPGSLMAMTAAEPVG